MIYQLTVKQKILYNENDIEICQGNFTKHCEVIQPKPPERPSGLIFLPLIIKLI